jgi:membrane fusion protein (multidrug efflux system)
MTTMPPRAAKTASYRSPLAGRGSRILQLTPLLLALALWASGCGGDDGGNARASADGAPRRPSQPPVPVAIDLVHTGPIASYYEATATLAPEKEAEILSRVAGVVKTIPREEGDEVAAGDLLLTIENDEYLYRLRQAEAARADLQSRLDRVEEMHNRELVSIEEYETLKNDLKAAEAEEGLARVNLSYTRVAAPFSGRVVTRSVDVGQTVNVGTPLFVLSDFQPLLARVHVPARQFNRLKPDQPVDLVIESDGTRLKGRTKLVSPTIDPASGTIKVTVEITDYPASVRPGDFAQVRVVTERRENSTLVPRIALVTDRGEQVVYVAADSTAERRVVDIGFEDDTNAEILDGVAAGERIIVKGQRSLKHGSPIKILETDAVAESDTVRREGS